MIRAWVLTLLMIYLAGCIPLPGSTTAPTETFKPPITGVTPIIASVGIIKGKVNVGPLSPVVRLDQPTPTPSPEVYTSRAINIFNADNQILLLQVHFKPDGTFQVELPPGKYRIELVKNGMDRAKELPKTIELGIGQIVRIDIDIDTGMR